MASFLGKNKYSISGDVNVKKPNQHAQASSNITSFTSINQNTSPTKSPLPASSAQIQAQNVLKNNLNANNVNKSQVSLTNSTPIAKPSQPPQSASVSQHRPQQQQQSQPLQSKHSNLVELRQSSAKSQDFNEQQKHHSYQHQQLIHSSSSGSGSGHHHHHHHHQQQQQQQQHQQQQLHHDTSHQHHNHHHPHHTQSNQQQHYKPSTNSQPNVSREPPLSNNNHNKAPNSNPINNNNNAKLLNLIVKSERHSSTNSNEEIGMFDPEPAREEAETYSHTIFLDDKSFIVDDDELDKEVSSINSKANRSADKSSVSSRDSVHIVNEVPEGRLSKKSSRSSQSSVCSNSTHESSNICDSISYNTDQAIDGSMGVDSVGESEGDGYKNEVLDTLMRKFNVNIGDNNGSSTPNSNKNRNFGKNSNEIQKKIQRAQINKQNTYENFDEIDSKNSKPSQHNSDVIKRNLKLRDIKVNCLPQTFNCKYLGKVRCQGLWGVRYTREPIDRLVVAAKGLHSIDELPTMEALISEQGIFIVQKQNPNNKNKEKIYRSGLIPISNISYGVQDNKFGKIFSCIVVRERDGKTLCECYAFLNSKTEIARRMALSLTLAFKEYGKLMQIKESKIRHTILLEEKHKNRESNRDSVA